MSTRPGKRILIIRRDNIGDLVCTTPMFTALRRQFPDAHISALVNSYNMDVLQGNPDLDAIHVYTKAKHRPPGTGLLRVYWDRLRLILHLREMRLDYAIIAGAHFLPRALRFARLVRPKHILGFTEEGKPGGEHIDMGVPYTLPHPMHEVEDIIRVLAPLGIAGHPPPLTLIASAAETASARSVLASAAIPATAQIIGVHISARKLTQRWPAERFIQLIRLLAQEPSRAFMLFWSPGDENNPLHPGDDSKASAIMEALRDVPIVAYPTHQLRELIGGLSLCDQVICSDGGAMHLAAGLGKPILCFFGRSDATRWYPWGVPHVLLQPASQEVTDISVAEAAAGFQSLLARTAASGGSVS